KLVLEPASESPWLTVHRFLAGIGVAIPALYVAEHPLRAMLVEDVGEVSLFDAVRAHPAETPDLFRLAVEMLLQFHVEGTKAISPDLLPAKIAYDERLFRWELKEFLEVGHQALGPHLVAEA